MQRWYNTTLSSAVRALDDSKDIPGEPKVLLLADSWSGQTNSDQKQELLQNGVKLLQIFPSTTDRLQPLDVNFNRQL